MLCGMRFLRYIEFFLAFETKRKSKNKISLPLMKVIYVVGIPDRTIQEEGCVIRIREPHRSLLSSKKKSYEFLVCSHDGFDLIRTLK